MNTSPNTQPYFVHQLKLGPWDNFVYFIGDRKSRTCAVVDPAWHAQSILDEAASLDLEITEILCTHSHFDHVDQVPELLKTLDIPVHMLREEVDFSGFSCENLRPGTSGDIITLGQDTKIRLMHTPGHTPGSTCFGLDDGVVCGDTLFVQGCGRCDFVGGDPKIMYATLKK